MCVYLSELMSERVCKNVCKLLKKRVVAAQRLSLCFDATVPAAESRCSDGVDVNN